MQSHIERPSAPSSGLVVGLFVGGMGSRFGGVAKGNLRHPNGLRLIERLACVCREGLSGAPLVLVGQSAAYSDLELPTLGDSPAGIGPLGGLRALLRFARDEAREGALALACDLPFVTPRLVRRLAHESKDALAFAAREQGLWHALAARYSTTILPVLDDAIAAREHSLQRVFGRLGGGARALAVESDELRALADWDRPEDMSS